MHVVSSGPRWRPSWTYTFGSFKSTGDIQSRGWIFQGDDVAQREEGSGLRSGREGGAMLATEGRKPGEGSKSMWQFSEDEFRRTHVGFGSVAVPDSLFLWLEELNTGLWWIEK